jgi:MFS family permease
MEEDRSQKLLLWLVAIGFFMETLDSTIVNTALPGMARSLKESPLYMQSVVIAYSLTIALFIPASGWITDRFGIKKVYLSAIVLFSLGSLCCALSQDMWQLVL